MRKSKLITILIAILCFIVVKLTFADTYTVNSGMYYYSPSTITIQEGDTVVWMNQAGYHNVNFNTNSVTGQSYNNPVSFINYITWHITLYSFVTNFW